MRCYFMRNGHIAAVEILDDVKDDATAIKRGSALFLQRVRAGFEGFEIWERDRMVFQYPEDDSAASPAQDNGSSSSKATLPKPGRKTAPRKAQMLSLGA